MTPLIGFSGTSEAMPFPILLTGLIFPQPARAILDLLASIHSRRVGNKS